MDAEKPKFPKGAALNGVHRKTASEVRDLLDKFANYGFYKSHAAAYAVVSYQTAWLKANHPVEFMAGVMNCDLHLTDKLAVYAKEVRRNLGTGIVPPCVNRSEATFSVRDGKVVYALGALKDAGVEAMTLITRRGGAPPPSRASSLADGANSDAGPGERPERPFVNLFDFARRVDLKRIGKRPLEMLARAGAFDQLDPNRRGVFDSLDALTGYSAAIHDQKNPSQVSLFGEAGDDLPEPRVAPVEDWLPNERLAEEHKAIGFYLSGHPLDDHMGLLKRKGVMTLADVAARAERAPLVARMAGAVAGRQERKSARGNRFAFAQLSDPNGLYEVMVFSDTLESARKNLEPGTNVVLSVQETMEVEQLKLPARSITPVDTVGAEAGGMGLRAFVDAASAIASVAALLERATAEARTRARGRVQLCLMAPDLPGEVEIALGDRFCVTLQVKGALKSLGGVVTVENI